MPASISCLMPIRFLAHLVVVGHRRRYPFRRTHRWRSGNSWPGTREALVSLGFVLALVTFGHLLKEPDTDRNRELKSGDGPIRPSIKTRANHHLRLNH